MVSKDILQLVDRFRKLELHAAHSGREVLRALVKIIDESQGTTLAEVSEELHENIQVLMKWLPPYAPPLNNINRILLKVEKYAAMGASLNDLKQNLAQLQPEQVSPQNIHKEIANILSGIVYSETVVYTHTLSETVLGVLLELHRMGKLKLVIATESRPNNDGWDTARRLAENGLRVQLMIDAAMPAAVEKADLMLSGAEVIRQDGSVVGKIGAFPAALLCQKYHKPLYIVADTNKISQIPWNSFYNHEIDAAALGFDFSHPFLQISGSYFDVTPAPMISAYATELGLFDLAEIQAHASRLEVSQYLIRVIQENEPRKIPETLIEDIQK